MKKLFAIFVIYVTSIYGNPIDPTRFYINEVFIEDSSWVIELPVKFSHTEETFYDFIDDTLIFKSKGDSIFFPVKKMRFFDDYCCMYSDSIDRTFFLDPNSEILSIVVKDTSQYSYHSELSYGTALKKNPSILI